MIKATRLCCVAALGAVLLAGCSPREERLAAGAGVGAAAGAIVGGLATGRAGGALAGAAIGAVGGAVVADATRPRYRCWYNAYGDRVCRRRF